MMTTYLSLLAAVALMVVGSLRRQTPSLGLDLALYAISALVLGLAFAPLPLWVRVCYALLGLIVVAGATRSIVSRYTAQQASP